MLRRNLTNYWLPVTFEGVKEDILRENPGAKEVEGHQIKVDIMDHEIAGSFYGYITKGIKPKALYGALIHNFAG